MPTISQTEAIALKSGTVGLEKYIFNGRISQDTLKSYKPKSLTAIDQKMMDRVPVLAASINEYDILQRRQTPASHPFWKTAQKQGFFSLIVPEAYGGNQMSSTGLSQLLQSLSSVSASLPVHVMVPNSLGPAELLAHYGTEAQKQHFLPQLANGAIPCFGLTSLHAGSDAAGSMTDVGVVVWDGTKPRIRLNCAKRYITLAPVADIVGLAFKLEDPEGHLSGICGRSVHGEITLALLERGHPNLVLGPYSDPLGTGFANGTVTAKDAMIDIEDVIGGIDGLGNGWKFLMEALAAGRGTALPAGAAGSSKMLTNAVSAYTTVRRQFKLPIHKFEGIQEKLADMAIKTFEIDSLVALMNVALDNGERPPVMSAILKQRTTELGRDVVNHAMDICAGAAICMGPQNFVAPAYLSTPIGITVEGSNTMTRSLLIFGQGVVRSHPHMLDLIHAIENNDQPKFAQSVYDLILDNAILCTSFTFHLSPLERFARFFALSSNLSLVLGGELKRREFLSGRYADMLSYILAGFAMEWHASQQSLQGRSCILEAAQAHNLHRLQRSAQEMIDNHPHSAVHYWIYMRMIGFVEYKDTSDELKTSISEELCRHDSSLRNLFDQNTLARVLHPNVRRMYDIMSRPDAKATPEELEKVLSVDVFETN